METDAHHEPRQATYQRYLKKLVGDLADWDSRYAPLFAKFEPLTLFAETPGSDSPVVPILNLIMASPRLAVLGVAGAGKTTTLRRATLEIARKALDGQVDAQIPVLVALRDYGPSNIRELVEARFRSYGLNFADIQKDLDAGRFVLIFDGINEVADDQRENCCKELRHFMRLFPANRYLYTARRVGYHSEWLNTTEEDSLSGTQPDVPSCAIIPLTREQIANYIGRHFLEAADIAADLIEQLKLNDDHIWNDPASLVHLAEVPIQLQMLILTFELHRRIPRNEADLLLQFVDYMLSQREPNKIAGRFPANTKKTLLAAVAWEMRQHGLVAGAPERLARAAFVTRLQALQSVGEASSDYSAEDIWREVQSNNLLIVEGEQALWPHPLFHDLFVGLKLNEICFDMAWAPRHDEIAFQCSPLRAKWFGDPWFDTGVTMLCLVPPSARVSALVAMAGYNHSIAWQAYVRMEPEYDPELGRTLLAALEAACLSSEQDGAEHRMLVNTIKHFDGGEALCALFQKIAQQCPSWEGRQEALGATWAKCRADSEESVLALVREVAVADSVDRVRVEALAMMLRVPNTKTGPLLVERLLTETSEVAKRVLSLMGNMASQQMFVDPFAAEAQLKQGADDRRARAIWILGETGADGEQVRNMLRRIASGEKSLTVRWAAVRALRRHPSRATVNTLGKALRDNHKPIRLEAIRSLEACEAFDIGRTLVHALGDADVDVGQLAADVLLENADRPSTFEALTEAADSSDVLVRRRAISTLGNLALRSDSRASVNATCELQKHRRERDKLTQVEVARGLYRHDRESSIAMLRKLLNDSDTAVCADARERCQELGIPQL